MAVLVWSWPTTPALLPPITHAFDLVAFSIFMYFTHGPTSPFFVYLVFALLCGPLLLVALIATLAQRVR